MDASFVLRAFLDMYWSAAGVGDIRRLRDAVVMSHEFHQRTTAQCRAQTRGASRALGYDAVEHVTVDEGGDSCTYVPSSIVYTLHCP